MLTTGNRACSGQKRASLIEVAHRQERFRRIPALANHRAMDGQAETLVEPNGNALERIGSDQENRKDYQRRTAAARQHLPCFTGHEMSANGTISRDCR